MRVLLRKLNITDGDSFWFLVKQFIQFVLVGVSNAAINLTIYYVLVYFGMFYILANTIGYIIGVLNSYLWNSRLVFKTANNKQSKAVFVKTFVAYGITFLLSTIQLFIMVDLLEIPNRIAPLINIVITTPINFLLNKFWVHRNEEK